MSTLLGAAFIVGLLAIGDAAGQLQAPPANAVTNEDVIALHKAGLSVEVMITAIRQAQERRFDISPQALITLAEAGVPDLVIREMQRAAAPGERVAPTLAEARTAFLTNVAVVPRSAERFVELETGLRKWGRLTLTENPELADVTITFGAADSGAVVGLTAGDASFQATDVLLTLTIQQNGTGVVLWSSAARRAADLLAPLQRRFAPILEIQGRERWNTTLPNSFSYLTKTTSGLKLELEGNSEVYEPVANLEWNDGRWVATTKSNKCRTGEALWEVSFLSASSLNVLLRCQNNRRVLSTTLTRP